MRDAHEVEDDHQNMSMEDNPGFESIDEVDGALPLAEAQQDQPMEAAVTVSCLKKYFFFIKCSSIGWSSAKTTNGGSFYSKLFKKKYVFYKVLFH